MHLDVTIKNVSWPHISWATLYMCLRRTRATLIFHSITMVFFDGFLKIMFLPLETRMNTLNEIQNTLLYLNCVIYFMY